jgi:site-specific DNA-methyltransferase (adenine-specific)
MKNKVFNMNCIEGMKQYPDNYFELAIVDPPYGIGMDGQIGGNKLAKATKHIKKQWDNAIPNKNYFNELIRVSKHQIIWGANHFIENIPSSNSSCWIVWDKENSGNFADCELAYTNFKTSVRKFSFMWNGMLQGDMKNKENRIHPTQKPVKLYKWLLTNYAKEGDKILDTHLGSGSSRIAAYDLGFEFTGFELDKDYFEASEKRFKQHIAQLTLF